MWMSVNNDEMKKMRWKNWSDLEKKCKRISAFILRLT